MSAMNQTLPQAADIRLLSEAELEAVTGGVAPLVAFAAAFSLFYTGTLGALAAQKK